MSKTIELLENRTTSSFPNLSIGTGLAFESLFEPMSERYDKEREIPNKVNPNKYSYFLFNITTLIRNIINAIEYKERNSLFRDRKIVEYIIDILFLEINSIAEILSFNNSTLKPYFYYNDTSTLARQLDNFKPLSEMNDFKRNLELLNHQILNYLKKEKIEGIEIIKLKLPTKLNNSLIFTHLPIDLLNYNRIHIELLESNTGKLKTYKDFNTKYHPIGKQDITIFPFREKLLYILGDKVYIKPESITIRKRLLRIAEESNWNVITTDMKIRKDISRDKELREIYDSKPRLF